MACSSRQIIQRFFPNKLGKNGSLVQAEYSSPINQRRIWWKEAVVYEIYWESFISPARSPETPAIVEILDKLEYLRDLGVDIIWLTPIFVSPRKDSGYDVADFYGIDSKFGTHDTFCQLVSEAKGYGISIMLDMVFNHVSDRHEWFVDASINPESKYADYFIWASEPLPDVPSFFSKSAWRWVPGPERYVRHSFLESQIDLNWENPSLRRNLSDILRFWASCGVRGFRLDVINLVDKKANKPDLPKWLAELAQYAFGIGTEIVLVGECPGITPREASNLTRPENKGLSMVLHTDLTRNMSDPSIPVFIGHQKVWQDRLNAENGWNSLYLGNHDTPRVNSRYGNDSPISAKLFGAVGLLLQGTPFIYQGEEIGAKNVAYDTIEWYRDIETLNKYSEQLENGMSPAEALMYAQKRSRDGARGPIDWTNASEQRTDPLSVLSWFRKLISLRKQESDTLVYGSTIWLPAADSRAFCFARIALKTNSEPKFMIVVVLNLSNSTISQAIDFKVALKDRFIFLRLRYIEILASNYGSYNPIKQKYTLKPYECLVFRLPINPSGI